MNQKNYSKPLNSEDLGFTALYLFKQPYLSKDLQKIAGKNGTPFPKSTLSMRKKELEKLGVWLVFEDGLRCTNPFAPLDFVTTAFHLPSLNQQERNNFAGRMASFLFRVDINAAAEEIVSVFGRLDLRFVLIWFYLKAIQEKVTTAKKLSPETKRFFDLLFKTAVVSKKGNKAASVTWKRKDLVALNQRLKKILPPAKS